MEITLPFDSNGIFSLVPGYLAVTGQTILSSQHNPPLEDIGSALSQAILRSGVAPFSGNQSMAGFKITNAANGSSDGDYVTMSQLNAVISSITANAVPTGARQGFLRTTPPDGWVKGNGGTIGNASSNATNRANADTEDLFTLFWNQFNNTILPIFDSAGGVSTRGASAAADFAANKRLRIFDLRNEFDRGADDGRGYDATATVGATQTDVIKNHVHPGTTADSSVTIRTQAGGTFNGAFPFSLVRVDGTAGTVSDAATPHSHTFTTNNNTGGIALETRPRSVVTLHCIKL